MVVSKFSFYFLVSLLISSFTCAASAEHGSTAHLSPSKHYKPDHTRLFSPLNGRSRLEKSFKASCVNGLNGNRQTCTYSIVTRVATTPIDRVVAIIYLNGFPVETQSVSIPNPTLEYNFNFEVHPNDNVWVFFNAQSPTDSYSFNVYNAVNPTGLVPISTQLNGAIVLSSTSTTFNLLNSCSGSNTCPLHIFGFSVSPSDWATSGVSVKIHVNGNLVGTFDGTTFDVNVFAGDTIVYEVTGTTIPYGLAMTSNLVVGSASFSSYWYSNSYFSPAIVRNGCSDLKSPFGGPVVETTTDQVNLFLSENSIPSTRKVSLTVPNFTDDEYHNFEL